MTKETQASVADIRKPSQTQPSPTQSTSTEAQDTLAELCRVGGSETETVKALVGVVEGVLRGKAPSDACERIGKAFSLVLAGETWGDAIDAAGVSWAMIHAWGQACQPYKDLLQAVCAAGAVAIKEKRIQAAHKRAVKGVLEPVFQGGQHVGDILRYSDRLLELLLKGDDPQRYNPQATGAASGQGGAGPVAIQINVVTADRSATSTVIDVSTPDVTP